MHSVRRELRQLSGGFLTKTRYQRLSTSIDQSAILIMERSRELGSEGKKTHDSGDAVWVICEPQMSYDRDRS